MDPVSPSNWRESARDEYLALCLDIESISEKQQRARTIRTLLSELGYENLPEVPGLPLPYPVSRRENAERWIAEDDAVLIARYATGEPGKAIANELGRTVVAVYARAKHLREKGRLAQSPKSIAARTLYANVQKGASA